MPERLYVVRNGRIESTVGGPDLAPGTPPAQNTTAVIGMEGASSSTANFNFIQTQIGKTIQWRRGYDSTGNIPASWNAGQETGASTGVAHTHWSFKTPVGTQAQVDALVSGAQDAKLIALANTIPANQRLTFYHEPEGPSDFPGSGADAAAIATARATNFKNCFQHVYNVMKPHLPASTPLGIILTTAPYNPVNSNHPNIAIWTGASSDFFGLDSYNGNGTPKRQQQTAPMSFGNATDWLAANRPGVPIVMSEWGSTYTGGLTPPYDRPSWIKQSWAWFNSLPTFIGGYYWSSAKYRFDRMIDPATNADLGADPASIAAFGSLV